MMLACNVSSFGTAWINHYYFAIAGFDVFELLAHIWRGHNTAVRCQRIATNDEHISGAIDVRHGDTQHMPKQVHADDMVR